MKKLIHLFLLLVLVGVFSIGCGIKKQNSGTTNGSETDNNTVSEEDNTEIVFEAKVIENNQSLLVEPVEGSQELKSSDRISVGLSDGVITDSAGKELTLDTLNVGAIVEITYDGVIAESYPAQIHGNKVVLISMDEKLSEGDESKKAELTTIFDKEVNNFDGVSMKLLEATETTIKVELLNTTDLEVNFGSDYDLQQLVDGKWYSLSYLIDNWAFTAEAYTLATNEPYELDVNWEVFHGSLSEGDYRFVKTVMDFRATGDYTNYYLATEFEIK